MRVSLPILLIVVTCSLVVRSLESEKLAHDVHVTLEQAINRTITYSPRLGARSSLVEAAKGSLTQAGLLPNPQLTVQAENFLGSGRYSGFRRSEITYSLGQTLEFPAKIHSRKEVAGRTVERSEQELEIERLDVIRDVRVAYSNAIFADEKTKITREHRELSESLLRQVQERVQSGRESVLEKIKAEVEVAETKLAFYAAERERRHAIHVLSSLWGGHEQETSVDASSASLDSPPAEEAVETALLEGPDMKRWRLETLQQSANYEMARASGFPDFHLMLGLRHLVGSSDLAVVGGLSVPLPLFNRNQGTIERAKREVTAAEREALSSAMKLRNDAFEQLESNTVAYQEAISIRDTILKAAERTLEIARNGYSSGRFPCREVLDAKRKLFEVKERYAAVLNTYSRSRAELERLVTKNLFNESNQEQARAK